MKDFPLSVFSAAARSPVGGVLAFQAGGQIPLTTNIVKAAINDEFVEWDNPIRDGDQITLLPPFSGG